jgi:hypothetical protein
MRRIIFSLMLFGACGTVKNVRKQNIDIVGTWCLTTNQINYPTITFGNDSLVTLGSKMDTVYSHKYYLQGDRIYFVLANGKISESEIIRQVQDSLILKTLLELKTEQIYYRCKDK